MQEYADPVIDWLDAGRGILDNRFFRDVSANRSSEPVLNAEIFTASPVHNFRTDHTPKTCH